MNSNNESTPGDPTRRRVLKDGQWVAPPFIVVDKETGPTLAVKVAPTKRRLSRRASAESWYYIFWLLAGLCALGMWIAVGSAADDGAIGFGGAIGTLAAWLPVIAFFDIMRREP